MRMNQPSRSWTEAALWPPLQIVLQPILEVAPLVPLVVLLTVAAIQAARAKAANLVLGSSNVRRILAIPPAIRIVEIAAENNMAAGCIKVKSPVTTVAAETVVAVPVEQMAVLVVIPAAQTGIIMEMATDMESTLDVDVAATEMAITKGVFAPAVT